MVSYKVASLIQSILIIIVGISTVDAGNGNLEFNETIFPDDPTEFWNIFTMWAYAFFVVGLLQLIKSDP